jgi:hypothetical protein
MRKIQSFSQVFTAYSLNEPETRSPLLLKAEYGCATDPAKQLLQQLTVTYPSPIKEGTIAH